MERQTVSSRQNPLVKFVCGLAEKKKRVENGLFRFDGVKLFGEALDAGLKIKYVIYREPVSKEVSTLLEKALKDGRIDEKVIVAVTEGVFEKLSEERSPEGIICVAHFQNTLHELANGKLPSLNERIIVAQSLRDPGNLGTVMRSAYALGIDTLVLTDDCADIYNPRTLRAAMGAAFKLKTLTVRYSELPDYVGKLRDSGRRVFAAALSDNSKNIGDIELTDKDCFLIGNEGHGLSEECIAACDASVIIPMRDGAESLNAAAAATICIWETVRA